MTDYSGEFLPDPGIIIKPEPGIDNLPGNTTASVPIPVRRALDSYSLREFSLLLEGSPSSFHEPSLGDALQSTSESHSLDASSIWMTKLVMEGIDEDATKSETDQMEDDDIFQVDKADLIQGPTLAELNANDGNLFEDLNFDDLQLPEENSFSYINISDATPKQLAMPILQINSQFNNNVTPSSCPQSGLGFYKDTANVSSVPSSPYNSYTTKSLIPAFSPTSQTSSSSSLLLSASSPSVPPSGGGCILHQKYSALQELLMKGGDNYGQSPDQSILGQSVPGQSMSHNVGMTSGKVHQRLQNSRLSSSAPTHLGLEQIWQRREPRKHLLSTSSLAEAGSTSSLSTGGVLSPEAPDFSHDEFSDEDSEHYEDYSSDGESDDESFGRRHPLGSSKKQRYFWQYNVQAKGPKGQRLIMKTKMEDPHVLNRVTDPVFSPSCSLRGIKHSGKARKGDGNDLTPNPRKLFTIGKELDKLGRVINDMTPVSELPFNVRPKSRKEKNKLASRACRLKKKAQHEANKIKLYGLENEHKRLISALMQTKQVVAAKLKESPSENQQELTNHLDAVIAPTGKIKIAGHTTEYVNRVLEKVKGGGNPGGSLEEF